MSDNVGLPTPRGSGTSGYVQRNLAHMRPRDPLLRRDREAELRHKQRQPDKSILEHDRKREIEVKVFELRDQLEEEEVDEEEIESRCTALREKLLAQLSSGRGAPAPKRNLKSHQVHELAEAKIKESERLRKALNISKDYEEGGHWKKQEERVRRAVEQEQVSEPSEAPKEDARSRGGRDDRMGRDFEDGGRDAGHDSRMRYGRGRDERDYRSRGDSRDRSLGRSRSPRRSWSRSLSRSLSRSRSRSASYDSDRESDYRRRG